MALHPSSLGKYRIVEVLGEGAMGVVYKGFDPGIQRTVALKTVRRQLLQDGELAAAMSARFRTEAQAAGRLSHPGIVAVYDFGEEGELAFIAMEFVAGNPLERYLENQVPFGDEDVASVLAQLLDALEHAHAHGVWHRDIKPANVLMTREGRVKVADFGIARIDDTNLTQVGSMIGTPTHMAPEQFRGSDIDHRVDLYGAGVLLYQLLVGRPPFTGSLESLTYKVLHEAPVLPSAVPGCRRGAAYDGVIATALAKDPQQRFANAAAFKRALLAVVGQTVSATVSDRTIVALPPPRQGEPIGMAAVPPPPPATQIAATRWDPLVLAQVESTLAHHIGPVAAVLVRRTASACDDMGTLVARLAEQLTDPGAKAAFLKHSAKVETGGGSRRGTASAPAATAAAAAAAATTLPLRLDDALVAQATRLLAAQVGPIAGVLVKRALARGGDRAAFFGALADSVGDGKASEDLRAALQRLG